MLRIGDFQTDSRVLLAPIAGYTDRAFRLVVRAAGHRGLAYTELLHPRGIKKQSKQALDISEDCADDQPLGVQLYGNDVDWFCEAAQWAEDHGARVIDINMGCPVDKVTKNNGGSMLLCDPDRTTRMVDQVVRSVSVPLTAKLRLGWDREHITAPRLARQLEEVGVSLITIHGRTTKMRFKGQVNLDGIASVVAVVERVPVIGNGDVRTVDDALHMMEYTKCAGVMVARASIKTPWLLRDIDAALAGETARDEPTIVEKIQLVRLHFDRMMELRGERDAVSVMRGRIAAYGTSMGHIRPIKERIRLMQQPDEFYAALDDLQDAVDPSWTRVPPAVIRADEDESTLRAESTSN